ncbi:MAG: adenylyl-sulfate kinase [Proteobacteria bacterium]|nr:adenylyl-sulfate kinase [Pseudomonadota bacterium]MBU1611954.1 adenylyl-sulfate kinase [Pseudomonadota bacterium]
MKYATPKVIWLVGMSGQEKSILAEMLQDICRNRSIPAMVVKDEQMGLCSGDACQALGLNESMRLGHLAKTLANQGYPVIVSAPPHTGETLAKNRAELPGYFEVYLASEYDSPEVVPVAPDLRVFANNLLASIGGFRDLAEDIFEEVFGRGQLMPEALGRAHLPAGGLQSALQAI